MSPNKTFFYQAYLNNKLKNESFFLIRGFFYNFFSITYSQNIRNYENTSQNELGTIFN